MDQQTDNKYLVPSSIIVAGFLVAFAIFYTQGSSPSGQNAALGGTELKNNLSEAAKSVSNVTSADHVLGNPDAEVKVIEFSDLSCPFCKQFHPTMKKIIDEYGKDGRVAWVYRHFPLDSIHPNAPKQAEASECAAELGGNAKFWEYIDLVFQNTPSGDFLDNSELPNIAEQIGISRSNFESCLDSGRYTEHVAANSTDATNSGGTGTPFSIIITSKGDVFPFTGALKYNEVKSLVDEALESLKN